MTTNIEDKTMANFMFAKELTEMNAGKTEDLMNLLDYYRTHGSISNPGKYAQMLEVLPDSMEELVKIVQGLFIHIYWAQRYGLTLVDEQKEHVQTRYVSDMLALILQMDDAPLTKVRPLEKRFVGNCRDFSVFLTAVLRTKGVPARARCGFGRYFQPGKFEDHWICEYWDGERWVSVDPQLDDLQKQVLGITFDTLDMPHEEFVRGGEAWKLARTGQENPDDFGILDMSGLGFIRGDFCRDLAALNKVELLPWDCWGINDLPDDQLTADDLVLLDQLADLMVVEDAEMYQLYQDGRFKVPAVIKSYTAKGPLQITLKSV